MKDCLCLCVPEITDRQILEFDRYYNYRSTDIIGTVVLGVLRVLGVLSVPGVLDVPGVQENRDIFL